MDVDGGRTRTGGSGAGGEAGDDEDLALHALPCSAMLCETFGHATIKSQASGRSQCVKQSDCSHEGGV